MQAWVPRCRPSTSCLPILRLGRGVEQWREQHNISIRRVQTGKANVIEPGKGQRISDVWKGQASRNDRKVRPSINTKSWPSIGKRVKEDAFDREGLRIINNALETIQLDDIRFDNDEKPQPEDLERFCRDLNTAFSLPASQKTREIKALYLSLRANYVGRGLSAVTQALQDEFEDYVRTSRLSIAEIRQHRKVADMRYPAEWYPGTRQLQRTIHLHVGPTNSGKTYQALKRLEQAKTGVYAGPLRLLAHEVYTRMNAKGKSCSLITGDDIRIPTDGSTTPILSCTVEMVPLEVVDPFDVAVIDEIQLMGDEHRGWAWTMAVLGIRAKELHLCGEERAVPLIRELAATMGDRLEIHKYERLNPLKVMSKSLNGSLKNLRKGDCVVMFSRKKLHIVKAEIEQATGKRCAIVYGSLPPDTRAQQAALFNDPDNDHDFLVASDAIGMGLNLNIKRIIFETSFKINNDAVFSRLPIAMVKQIAGRAGRYRTANQGIRASQIVPSSGSNTSKSLFSQQLTPASSLYDPSPPVDKVSSGDHNLYSTGMATLSVPENVGLVTTLDEADLPFIQDAMRTEAPRLDTAGIHPPAEVIKRFAAYFPSSTPFRFILRRLFISGTTSNRNFIASARDQLDISEVIEDIEPLSIDDRYIIAMCPLNPRDDRERSVLRAFARCIAQRIGGGFLEISEINLEVLDKPPSGDREYLEDLEVLHKAISLYCWLAFRFKSVFRDQPMAIHAKDLVEEQIERGLNEFSANRKLREKLMLKSQQMKLEWVKAAKRVEDLRKKGSDLNDAEEKGLAESVKKELSEEPSAPEETGSSWEAAAEDEGKDDLTDDTESLEEALGNGIFEEIERQQPAPPVVATGENAEVYLHEDDSVERCAKVKDEGNSVASVQG